MGALRSAALRLALFVALCLPSAGCNDCSLEVTTTTLPDAQVDVAYAMFLRSECGGDTWFIPSGSLPPGMGLRDDGLFSGTPTAEGSFQFTVGVYDFGSNEQAFQGLVFNVDPAS